MKAREVKNEVTWDWMRPEMVTIQAEATVDDAVARMRKFDVHHLLVMKGKVWVGTLDVRDCAGTESAQRRVSDLMQADLPAIDESTEVRTVLELMLGRHLTALPLLRNGEISGIITATDLLRLLTVHVNLKSDTTDIVERGTDILARPLVQSLMNVLGNAGI